MYKVLYFLVDKFMNNWDKFFTLVDNLQLRVWCRMYNLRADLNIHINDSDNIGRNFLRGEAEGSISEEEWNEEGGSYQIGVGNASLPEVNSKKIQ